MGLIQAAAEPVKLDLRIERIWMVANDEWRATSPGQDTTFFESKERSKPRAFHL